MENGYSAGIALWDPETEIIASPGYCSQGVQSGLRIGGITITFPGTQRGITHGEKARLARKIAAEASKIARHYENLAALSDADYDSAVLGTTAST